MTDKAKAPLAEATWDDVLWVAHNISNSSVEFKDAPSQLAWSLLQRAMADSAAWRDLQKIVVSRLSDEKRADDSESLNLTGMAESIRDGFGDLWEKVHPILKERTPAIL